MRPEVLDPVLGGRNLDLASESTTTLDIADYIYARKVARAQDRVDRPWLYH